MYFIGQDIQAGMIFVSTILTILLSGKCFRSGIPRLRVMVLCIFFLLFWFVALILSFIETGPSHSLLWDALTFFGLCGFLFILFIALYEILYSPGF